MQVLVAPLVATEAEAVVPDRVEGPGDLEARKEVLLARDRRVQLAALLDLSDGVLALDRLSEVVVLGGDRTVVRRPWEEAADHEWPRGLPRDREVREHVVHHAHGLGQ